MRCPDCMRFRSLETADPEVEGLEVDVDGTVSGSVRMVRCCCECSTEMKEANFDIDAQVEVPGADAKNPPEHPGTAHELEIEEVSIESTESGGGRYKKNLIGYNLEFKVHCTVEGCKFEVNDNASDALSAGAWDELS